MLKFLSPNKKLIEAMLFTVILNDTNQTPVVVVAAVVVDAAAVIGLCMLYVKSSSEKKTGSFTCK